ncbi:MAG TPA: vanadium-dependent haloperoxidase [Nocardioides sp.]|nr:vanadium-dependent haloperoxidase [Nocardioides sp.]
MPSKYQRPSRLLVAGLAAALATTVAAAPVSGTANASDRAHHGKTDTYVAAWDAIGTQAFTASALSPAEGHIIFGYAGIAVYDAVVAVRHKYEPFAIRTRAPRGASPEAAVVAAAHRIYEHYLPLQEAAILDPAYDESLATIPDGKAKDDGVAVGLRVANALIALRADDGFRADVGYTPPSPALPGDWVPTMPAPPGGTYLPHMQPFSLESADRFRPAGPPSLGSKRWARDYNEVKKLGSATSTVRKDWQTTAALFWGEAPVQQGHLALRGVIDQHDLDVVQAARMMAMVSVAYADGMIACFDAKYFYEFWRPITAIRAGDTDGNAKTVGDPTWMHLLPGTPNHPDYPSAHSCITPAGGAALAEFLGTRRIDLTIPSLTGLGDRHFDTVKELATEVGNARIWGGIHFRTAVEDGIRIARKTAAEVLDDNFERTRH